jgi:hypothetical protein
MVFGVSIELWADQGAKAFWAPRELARPLTLWVLIGPLALWVSIGLWAFWAAYVLVILAFTTPDRRRVYIWMKTVNELVVYKTTPRPIFCARRLISSHGVPQKD